MPKSIYSRDYGQFLQLLREAREDAGVTQAQLAKRLKYGQSMVSKCERGERRLDVIELRRWCNAIGISFSSFTSRLDEELR
ncbi:MAG: helix-turn-helix transcriptional regulator [Phycisphaerales bacterium]